MWWSTKPHTAALLHFSAGPFTVFGPTDTAFLALGSNILDFVGNGFNSVINCYILTVSRCACNRKQLRCSHFLLLAPFFSTTSRPVQRTRISFRMVSLSHRWMRRTSSM